MRVEAVTRLHSRIRNWVAPQEAPQIISDGKGLFWVDGVVTEGPSGPYNGVYTYGNPPHISGEILTAKQWKRDYWSHGAILAHDSTIGGHINELLNANSDLVNDGEHSPENPQDRLEYQKNLSEVFAPLTQILVEQLRALDAIGKPYVIGCPLNGGEYVAASLIYCARKLPEPYNIPFESFPHFELKRVFNGQLHVGACWGYTPDVTSPYIIVADDCIATKISAETTLRFLYEQYGYQDPKAQVPDRNRKSESLVVVAAASQVGMEQIIFEKNAKVLTGGLVINVGDDKYLYQARAAQKPEQATHYYVGDMGHWTMLLPSEMNGDAPWNAIRGELRSFWAEQEAIQGIEMLHPQYTH